MLTIGSHLGPYEILSALGAGGMGEGAMPHRRSDGKELFYADQNYNLYAVPVKASAGTLQFGAATMVRITLLSSPQFFYDVAADGKKFLLDRVAQQVNQSVSVVTNWTAALKK
jgi:hypothetical protein